METLREFVRVAALIAGVAYGLLLLNAALFRFWVAGGPPSENPAGWLFSAWSHLSWSGASVLAGIGIFLLLRRPRTGLGAALVLGLSAALALLPYAREFVAQDACLDGGGSWSEGELRCTKAPAGA